MIAFPVEWLALLLLFFVDLAWGASIGFQLHVRPMDFELPGICVAVMMFCRTILIRPRGALCAEAFALTLAATASFGVLTYLAAAAARPLVDQELEALDRSLGFDWLAWFKIVLDRPTLAQVMLWVYNSMIYQGVYFSVLFGIQGRRDRLRELFWATSLAGTMTAIVSIYTPALGTFPTFGHPEFAGYLDGLKRVRAGDLNFALSGLDGIVEFPSFHTTMAIIYAVCYRGCGVVSYFMVALNLLMLPTIPFIGGHYLVDMIGGGIVAALALPLAMWLAARDPTRRNAQFTAGPQAGAAG